MRYVDARMDESVREQAYRIYVTRSLQLAPQQKYVKMSYEDALKPQKVERRSGDEIMMDIITRAGLRFGGE